jgi:hypothetical protein
MASAMGLILGAPTIIAFLCFLLFLLKILASIHQLRLEQLIQALPARTQIVLAKIRKTYFNGAN